MMPYEVRRDFIGYGANPLGWYCRYGPGVNTRRFVVEEGGFLYDSDYYGEELPFWLTVEGKPHFVVPCSVTNNDGQFGASIGTSDQWFSFVRDALDMLYREGATQPKMMSIGLHMRPIGHPARAVDLQRLLYYIPEARGRLGDPPPLHRAPLDQDHPYPGKGLNE